MKLGHIIAFVADMDAAVQFYRDTLGFEMRFQSPEWTEFATGSTTLALHPSSATHPAGTMELGLHTDDMEGFAATLGRAGLRFTREPKMERWALLAEFADQAGTRYSVSAPK